MLLLFMVHTQLCSNVTTGYSLQALLVGLRELYKMPGIKLKPLEGKNLVVLSFQLQEDTLVFRDKKSSCLPLTLYFFS